jgi:hypothetical protein
MCQSLNFGDDRTATGLGWMCGQDKFNGKLIEQRLQLLGRHSLFSQCSDSISYRFTEWLGRKHTFTLTQLLDALVFFCKIDQIKISSERGRDSARGINIERFDLSFKLFPRFEFSAPTLFRGGTNAFFCCEQFW